MRTVKFLTLPPGRQQLGGRVSADPADGLNSKEKAMLEYLGPDGRCLGCGQHISRCVCCANCGRHPAMCTCPPAMLAEYQRRVEWSRDQGPAPMWPGGPTAKEYVDGLQRPTGSYVEGLHNLKELLVAVDVAQETVQLQAEDLPAGTFKEGHRYFVAPVPEGYTAFEAVALLDALEERELDAVRVVRGKHGYEFVAADLQTREVQTLVFICDEDGLVTWYPGRITAPMPDIGSATVKLLRQE